MFPKLTAPALSPTQPTSAAVPTAPARPFQPGAAPRGGFAGLIGSVQGEVERFIRHGDGAAAKVPPLSPEGRVQQLRTQGPQAADVPSARQQAFLAEIAPWAKAAGERLGVAPALISAHAALESAWGQRPLKRDDGSSTFNLFGIKAGPGWRGEAADAATTEYVKGSAVATTERFRSYPDVASAFKDFAAMLGSSPRFKNVLNVGSDAVAYAQGLVRGGYATDPAYAEKLTGVIEQVKRAGAF